MCTWLCIISSSLSSWSHRSCRRSRLKRTPGISTRSSRRSPSPSPLRRSVSAPFLSLSSCRLAPRATGRGRSSRYTMKKRMERISAERDGFNRPSVCNVTFLFLLLPTDDEDGMDSADSERRPHFPQFSYSASGREWCHRITPFKEPHARQSPPSLLLRLVIASRFCCFPFGFCGN